MEYRELETILAELHRVKPDDLGAFRSRLRVLRDNGVPAVLKPGKGSKVTYQFLDLWEAHLGLHLEYFGLPPARVKFVLEDRLKWYGMMRDWEKKTTADIWAHMRFSQFQKSAPDQDRHARTGIYPLDHAIEDIKFMQEQDYPAVVLGLINLSKLTRECESAMAKHIT